MDYKMIKNISDVIDKSREYWIEVNNHYGIKDDLRIPFTVYDNINIIENYDTMKDIVYASRNAVMISLLFPAGDYNDDLDDDHQIVTEIAGGVFMSNESLYQMIISCKLDFDKVFECMKFSLLHELGHFIDHFDNCMNKTVEEWNSFVNTNKEDYKQMPKLRRNASYEKRLEWYLLYNNIPVERRANEAVGITEEDIIKDFKCTHHK